MDEHCHEAKLVCHDVWAYSGRFFSMLGSVSLIVVYSKQLWSFHLVSATRIPYLLDPTKCTVSPFEHEYSVLALMDLVHLWQFKQQFKNRFSLFELLVTNFPLFEPVQDYVNAFTCLLTAISVTFNLSDNCSRVWQRSSSSHASKLLMFKFFGCPGRFLS